MDKEFETKQQPVRRGEKEYIKVGGKEKAVRRFDPSTGEFKYTALGKRFCANRARIQYVVKVSAVFSEPRSSGASYTRNGLFPLDQPVEVRSNMSDQEKDAEICRAVNEL